MAAWKRTPKVYRLSKDIILLCPVTSALPARERQTEPWAMLSYPGGTVTTVLFVLLYFSSRLWLTRKVEITNAWALCLGGVGKKGKESSLIWKRLEKDNFQLLLLTLFSIVLEPLFC